MNSQTSFLEASDGLPIQRFCRKPREIFSVPDRQGRKEVMSTGAVPGPAGKRGERR